MRRCDQLCDGFVLMVVLIFLFVMTLISVTDARDIILQNKMESMMQNRMLVFARAELGMQQMIFYLQKKSMTLPDSPIALSASKKLIDIDRCGNKTIDMTSIAQMGLSTVILNSRGIFAKVPREKDCKKFPRYRSLWWRT